MLENKSKQEKELERLIKEHRELCKEVKQKKSEYEFLNRELISLIAEYKSRMEEFEKTFMSIA